MTTRHHIDRLALDRAASDAGWRHAEELCAMRPGLSPAEITQIQLAAFRMAAQRALINLGIRGDHEAIINHLLEARKTAFDAEMNRQRRTLDRSAPA